MIKSEFTKVGNLKKELEFPVLAKAIGEGAIPKVVLFTSEKCGTCLWSMDNEPYSLYQAGFYTENWYPVTDENHWEILPRGFQITLTQE